MEFEGFECECECVCECDCRSSCCTYRLLWCSVTFSNIGNPGWKRRDVGQDYVEG